LKCQDQAISILSSRVLKAELKARILKALKVKYFMMSRIFYLITDKRRNVLPLCQAMVDFLKQNNVTTRRRFGLFPGAVTLLVISGGADFVPSLHPTPI